MSGLTQAAKAMQLVRRQQQNRRRLLTDNDAVGEEHDFERGREGGRHVARREHERPQHERGPRAVTLDEQRTQGAWPRKMSTY